MSSSLLRYSSKGQILLCYFYEVKRRGGAQAEEKQSKTFITDSYDPKRDSTSAFKCNTSIMERKITYTLPPPQHPSHLKRYNELKRCPKTKMEEIFVNRDSP